MSVQHKNSILFTYYPSFVRWNHGSALLTAICKQAGIEADYAPCTEIENLLPAYDIIAFSFVTDGDYEKALPYMRLAKKDAGKRVITGGGYARRGGRIEEVDFICRGEAEDGIVAYLNGDEQALQDGYVRPTIDNLPMPNLSHVSGYEFHRGQSFLKDKRIFPYQSSRGCLWGACKFCEIQFQEKRVRIKHTIADDLKYLQQLYNPQLFYLMDTTIPYCIPEWKEQWEKIYVPFQGYIRADIDPSDLEFLIDHGLKATAFGIESPNEKWRNDVLKKGVTNKQIERTVKKLQKYNIFYIPFFMLGVPGEPEDSREETVKMIERVKGYPMVWQYADLSRNINVNTKH